MLKISAELEALKTQDGWYPIEQDDQGSFRWSSHESRIPVPQRARFLMLRVGRPNDGATLTIGSRNQERRSLALIRGWHSYDIDIGADHNGEVLLFVDRSIPTDPRKLGVMLRSYMCHQDQGRHDLLSRQFLNARRNENEYRSGAEFVQSVPPNLRISMETHCNIANEKPCVYCAWKKAKHEERTAPPFDLDFATSLGDLVELSSDVTDCGIGEPTMHPRFADLVERLSTEDRVLVFTTNGQPLGSKIRDAILGRNINLYVSIDSATAAGYARYRDHRFNLVVENIRALCAEKKLCGDRPHVTVSMNVMRSNIAELPAFIDLMHSVGVDRVKFRAIHPDAGHADEELVQQRGAFRFEYLTEALAREELAALGPSIKAHAIKLGLDYNLEWDNFVEDYGSTDGLPLCSEPWKTMYALSSGISPCCYGHKAITPWDQQGSAPVRDFLRSVQNGPEMREIRRELAAGKLPNYCKQSRNCPIVQSVEGSAHGSSRS